MSEGDSPTGTTEVVVVCANEQDEIELDPQRWCTLATRVLRVEGLRGELTVTFVGRDEMAELNAEHMGKSGPTDVLSFPLDAVDDASGSAVYRCCSAMWSSARRSPPSRHRDMPARSTTSLRCSSCTGSFT